MLEVARRKTIQTPPGNVALVEADAEHLDHVAAGLDGAGATFDAVLFTYSLSLMGNWEAAWRRATSLGPPRWSRGNRRHGVAPWLGPAARSGCPSGLSTRWGGYQRTSVDSARANSTRRAFVERARRARPGAGRDALTHRGTAGWPARTQMWAAGMLTGRSPGSDGSSTHSPRLHRRTP
jgi:hypothetical protein